MARFAIILVCLLSSVPAFGQTSLLPTLEKLRLEYPTPMSKEQIGELLNRVTWLHRSEGWGALLKGTGNRCPHPSGVSISCDILMYRPTGAVFDVLYDSDNAARPVWNHIGFIEVSRFVAPVGVPDPPKPPDPPDPFPSTDIVVDFGSEGTWTVMDGETYASVHSMSPETMVSGDLDGNGIDEVIIDFGDPNGLWIFVNNTSWYHLLSVSPSHMATGDLDGNGQQELIADFPGAGIWVLYNASSWRQRHTSHSTRFAVGNLDGALGDDLVVDFPGQGIRIYSNNSSWNDLLLPGTLQSPGTRAMTTGDFDGSGRDDLAVSFAGGSGTWVWRNSTSWVKLHDLSASRMAAGNLNGNLAADLVLDFGPPYGVWIGYDLSRGVQLDTRSTEDIVIGDVDGTGIDDVILDLGSGVGVWVYLNGTRWVLGNAKSPELMIVANLN